MLSRTARRVLSVLLVSAFSLILAGCSSSGGTGPDDSQNDMWVFGTGTSGADGLVTIDLGDLGTFRVQVRDGLTAEPIAGAEYTVVANAVESEVGSVVLGGDDYQIGVFTYDKDDVISDRGTVLRYGWDDLYPWVGGTEPIPGINGVAWIPAEIWNEVCCQVTQLATDTVTELPDGDIADELTTRSDNLLLATTYPPGATSVLVYVCWIDPSDPGVVLEELKDGVYLAQGYCESQELRLVEADGPCHGGRDLNINLIEPVVEEPGCVPTTNLGTVQGTVKDATTGEGIEGATVAVNGVQTTSSGTGTYQVSDVLPGDNVLVTAVASGYQPFSMIIAVGESEVVEQDVVLVPSAQSADQYRFVLTWGVEPRDLDSHLWVPTGPGEHFHVCFWNTGTLTTAPYAELDIDDMYSFGPETVTLLPEYEGQYVYAVHEWTGEGTLATSDAVVQIYAGNNLIRVLNVPTTTCGENYWWHVGTLNAETGEFTLINEFHQEAPLEEWRPEGVTKSVEER